VDEALNILLLKKKKKLTDDEKKILEEKDPIEVFEDHFKYATIKKDVGPEDISTSQYMDYYKSDFNPELLFDEDYVDLKVFMVVSGYVDVDQELLLDTTKLKKYLEKDKKIDPIDLFDNLMDKIKNKDDISLTDKCFINYSSWLSLRRKGHLLIETYEKEVLPQIKVVHSIQKRVNLPNDLGDTLVGVIDLECEFVGKKGIFTTDNKTSSTKYKESEIYEKQQLVIYDEYTENGQVAYIVLQKKPKLIKYKKCDSCDHEDTSKKRKCPKCGGNLEVYQVEPYVEWDIITKTLEDNKKDLVFDEISAILEEIKDCVEMDFFSKDTNNCMAYGKKCPFYSLCHLNSNSGITDK
ncbi:MAG TPA: hypothetical protein V6C96_00195, partial [Vampirovibrionales bacterium]